MASSDDPPPSSPISTVGTTNYAYILSEDHSWIPARILSTTSTHATVAVVKHTDENAIGAPPEPITSVGGGAGGGVRGGRVMRVHQARYAKQERSEKMEIKLSDYPANSLPLQNVDERGNLKEVEDMVDLPFLHEAAILYNLKSRHLRGKPYTRTGDIVIAVNPYKWIEGLYADEMRNLYAEKLVWDVSSEGDAKTTVEPHVYETSSLAYRGLAVEGQNQSILVSGESGAGKTETVKILMSHLASVQGRNVNYHDLETNKKGGNTKKGKEEVMEQRQLSKLSSFRTSPIVERVLDSNPLLEAFGNAKTVRNDNSSRFGKFIQLQFDTEDPTHAAYGGTLIPSAILAGSKCQVYLLEKSRVVSHEDEERTYHIFYQLLAAPDETKMEFWHGLEETDSESFSYVGYSDTDTIEGKTDGERWENTVHALGTVGVKGEKLTKLVRALCIVLQLGNLLFEPNPENDENSIISTTDELSQLAELMGVQMVDIQNALTLRTVRARNEEYKVPLNPTRAKDACDAFAKEIYANTFHWLVRTINDATCAETNYDQKFRQRNEYGIIGLLDIFGFESFQTNRFEQLCINYANEKLQQKFTMDIFRSVQSEYEFEGVELDDVTYADNVDVLNLVEGRMGLIAVLNEECLRPKGSDTAFVSKIYTMNKDSDVLLTDNFYRNYEFGIQHYAGPVVYDSTNFVTKNMDTLPSDLVECARKCSNELVRDGLGKPASGESGEGGDGGKEETKKKAPKRPPRKAPPKSKSGGKNTSAPSPGGGKGGSPTTTGTNNTRNTLVSDSVWTKFKSQLTTLMSSISTTRTRYIRCIKPNVLKSPKIMQHNTTVEQLRCAGVVAAVTISRSAFPNRLEHEEILERFMCLHGKGFELTYTELVDEYEVVDAIKDDVDRLLTDGLSGMEITKGDIVIKGFVVGRTRAYFRAGSLEYLEAERIKALGVWAVIIQRVVRGYEAKHYYRAMKRGALKVQSKARRDMARRRYVMLLNACVAVQCWARNVMAKADLVSLRKNYRATVIQTRWRMTVAKALLEKHLRATIQIQAAARGSIQRPIYRKELHEKKEEAKLENQLKALQKKLEEAEARSKEAERRAEEEAKRKIAEEEEKKRKAAAEEEEKKAKEEEEAAAKGGGTDEEKSKDTTKTPEKSTVSTPTPPTPPTPPPETPPTTPAAATTTPGQLTAQQQTLMDESGKMLEYLRKEVFKLRSQNTQLRTDFDLLKENNQRLMDANASAGASFSALNQHAKQLNKTNAKLMADVATYKQQVSKLNLAQIELKEELKMKQATYIAEVHSRLQYQKTMTRIVDTIQDRCRDSRLVEDILMMSDDCESDYVEGGDDGMGGGHHHGHGGDGGMPANSVSDMMNQALSPGAASEQAMMMGGEHGDGRPSMEDGSSFSSRFKSFFGA